ncbi:hypothetical protein Tco_1155792 [Tanacetum coccineum]
MFCRPKGWRMKESGLIRPSWYKRQPTRVEVGDKVMLEVSSWKDVVHLEKKEMLAPIYKNLADAILHVHLEEIKVDKTLRFVEEPVKIIDREVKSFLESSVKDKILAALGKVSKVENVTAEMLRGMDQLMERKEGGTDKTYYDLRDMYDGHVWRRILLPMLAIVWLVYRLPRSSSGCDTNWVIVDRLTKYWTDANLHVHLEEIKVDKTLCFVEEPVEIIDREVKSLKRSRIPIVKSIGTRSEVMEIS